MTNKTIIFYGPLPPKGNAPFGGGEVGNQRTLNILKSAGYHAKVVRRKRPKAKSARWLKIATLPFRVLWGFIEFTIVLIVSSRKSIVHIAGFYGKTIINEVTLLKIAKTLGFKVVYEMRGGGAIDYYNRLGSKYRHRFNTLVREADYLFSQGKENYPLIYSICQRDVFYYPNFIEKGFCPDALPTKPDNKWNLIYFGRLEPGKNTLMVIDIVSRLQNKYKNIYLTLIGSGQEDYVSLVKESISKKLVPGTCTTRDSFKHDELKQFLPDKHFFLFPTESEGHSNALTEAMGFGVVPIASRRGFNPTVVGEDALLVDNMESEEYYDVIDRIISSGSFLSFSQKVFDRIQSTYTEDIVSQQLLAEYDRIISSSFKS